MLSSSSQYVEELEKGLSSSHNSLLGKGYKMKQTMKITPTNPTPPGWSTFSLTEISACVHHSATLYNTIYYFLVYEMEIPYYNLKYSYWKRYTISRHHITTQTLCVHLIGVYTKSSYGRCGTPIFASTFFCHLIHYFLCCQSADEIVHSLFRF